MRRRNLVLLAAAAVATGNRANAQPSSVVRRAAVVIGVDLPAGLRPLRAAASGAKTVAAWLRSEGFDEVVELVDDPDPVTVTQVFTAVSRIVGRGTVIQLVIYFAGHGFINGYSEYWLLSGAPQNPNEAISLIESVALARQSGIPHVVFISDACRSRSESLQTERVRGSLIFPAARSAPHSPSDVDQFLATLVGDPSWEVPVDQSSTGYEGIYTATFLDAYRIASPDMVRVVGDFQVVPNAKLKNYLAREVPLRAARASITLKQRPDSQIVSGESSYIGKYLPDSGSNDSPSAELRTPDIQTVAYAKLAESGLNISAPGWRSQVDTQELLTEARVSGFEKASADVAIARGISEVLVKGCGFVISGAHVLLVLAPRGVASSFVNGETLTRSSAQIEIDLGTRRASSVCIKFGNGDGTVLAAIDGFVGHVAVDDSGVSNVSYIPAMTSVLYGTYERERSRIERLHRVVAASARFGSFKIEPARRGRDIPAANLAQSIRILKGIDPTLGLYAAYAYFDAGLSREVRSVDEAMQVNLSGARLFDTAMLAGSLPVRGQDAEVTVPFAPMLSQGWSLLRIQQVPLTNNMLGMRDNMRNSLWLTLNPVGVSYAARTIFGGWFR